MTRSHAPHRISVAVMASIAALVMAALFLVGGPGRTSSGQQAALVAGEGTLSGGVYSIDINVSNLPTGTTIGSYAVLVPFNGANVSFVSASNGALAVPKSDGSDQINVAQVVSSLGNGTLTTLTFNDTSGIGADPGFTLVGIELKEPDTSVIPVNSTGTVTITSPGGGNSAPVVSPISNQTIAPNSSTGPLAFSITDESTSTVTVTATSSNQSVIPNGSISVGGSGSNRTVSVSSGSTEGSATITVTATDGQGLSDTETFTITVQASSPGTPGQALVAGDGTLSGGVYSIDINVSNLPDGKMIGSYAVLVPFNGANVSFLGASNGALAVPKSDGSDQINVAQVVSALGNGTLTTLTFNDDSGTGADPGFTLVGIELKEPNTTAIPVNSTGVVTIGGGGGGGGGGDNPPTIGAIASLTLAPGATANGSFSVTDESPSTVTISVNTSNSSIASATVGGSGSSRTIAVTAGSAGSATITLTATDAGGNTGTRSFAVTVTSGGGGGGGGGGGTGGVGNIGPVISPLADQTVAPKSSTGEIPFTITDESPATVTVTGASSNDAVIPDAHVLITGTGRNRTLVVVAGSVEGTSTITITARDSGGLTDIEQFTVTVGTGGSSGGNQAPLIFGIGQRQLATNSSTGVIPFTVKDEQPSTVTITVVSSSKSDIVSRSDVFIGGSGSRRTFEALTGNTPGRVVITLRAQDAAGLTGQQTVVLTVVRPFVSQPPTTTVEPTAVATLTPTDPSPTGTPDLGIGGGTTPQTPSAGSPPDGDGGGIGGGTLLLLLLLLLAALGTVGVLIFAMRRGREDADDEGTIGLGESLPTPAVAPASTSSAGLPAADVPLAAPAATLDGEDDGDATASDSPLSPAAASLVEPESSGDGTSEAPAQAASGTGTSMTSDQNPAPQQPSAPQAQPQPLPPQMPPAPAGNGGTHQGPPAPQPQYAPQYQEIQQPYPQQPYPQQVPAYSAQPQPAPQAYVPNGNAQTSQPGYPPSPTAYPQQQPVYAQQPQSAPQPVPQQQQPAYQPQPVYAQQPGYPQQPAYQQQPMYQQPQPATEQQLAYPPPYVPGQYPPEQFAASYPPAAAPPQQPPVGYQPAPAPTSATPQPQAPSEPWQQPPPAQQ
jgi:hypothetical protein